MDVETALREIDEANGKHVGDEYERERTAYRETLEEVHSLAGGDAVGSVTTFVTGHIRDHDERPAPGAVQKEAGDVVRDHGGEVPPDSKLHV